MFARRAAPKGVRKRPTAREEDADGAAGVPSGASRIPVVSRRSDESDEEHARIVKKSKTSRLACKHFLMGRVSRVGLRCSHATFYCNSRAFSAPVQSRRGADAAQGDVPAKSHGSYLSI